MSIAPLERLTVFGPVKEKAAVLEGLQELGCLHLVGLRPPTDHPDERLSWRPKEVYEALRYLSDSPLKRSPVSGGEEEFDSAAIVEKTLWNRWRLRDVRDRADELRHQLQELEPWGDFRVPPPDDLGGLQLWFYVVPLHRLRRFERDDLTWQVVNQDHRHAYVVVISEHEPPVDAMPGPRVDLGHQSRSELRREEELAIGEEAGLVAERWELTQWIELLQLDLGRAEDQAALAFAKTQTMDSSDIFAVQGWVPLERRDDVLRFAGERALACTLGEPAPTDSPPVLLQNREPVAAGEDLVSFFQLPGYREWDPSAVVFVSFTLFFAMILSDAGYAAVLGIVLAVFWKRMGKSDTGRRMRRLASAIVAASVGYGALVGSYFGVTPVSGTLPDGFKLLDLNDFDSMMRVTVFVGAAHVVLANGVVAWNRRRSTLALASLGWNLVIVGGLLLAFWRSVPTLSVLGMWVLGAGGLAVLLFSSERGIQRPVDVLLRVIDGLQAATGVTTAVGDVLSYLRLFALGLSSASLAITFNGLAAQAMESVPGVGWVFGLGILIMGHVLNIVLAVMSGVVHGLRLNLIEFYRWGIYGEGRPFQAFRKKETLTWTH